MPARINHNAHLTTIHRNLAAHHAGANRSIQQLSSGMRVNRASDDPASLALADGISSEVRAVAEGTRNIEQTFSLLQVAEGSLSEIANMTGRMRSLAMQAATSVFSDRDRLTISSEFTQLRDEIDRIAGAATYNGRHLLTGANMHLEASSTALTHAADNGISDIRVSDASGGTYTFIDTPGDGTITLGNGVITQTVNVTDDLDVHAIPAGENAVVNFAELGIRVTLNGPDVVGVRGEYSDGDLDGQQIEVTEVDNFAFQVGPSETSNDVSRIRIPDMRATGTELDLGDLSISTMEDARQALTRLQEAEDKITVERNRIGAFQNRLQLSIETSMAVMERMRGTESAIREVDVARAAGTMAKSQILAQAATRVAVDADADIERILSLLR